MGDLDDLRAAEERLQQAQLASDLTALDSLLHPEATYVGPDGAVSDRQADLEAHRSGALRLDTLDCETVDARIYDDVGVTVVTARLAGEAGGQTFAARLRYSRAWGRGPAGWWVLSAHASLIT